MIEIKNNLTYLRLLNLFSKRISRMWSWIVNWKIPQIFPTFVKNSSQQNSYIKQWKLYNITNENFQLFFPNLNPRLIVMVGFLQNIIVCFEATRYYNTNFIIFNFFFLFLLSSNFFYKRGNSYANLDISDLFFLEISINILELIIKFWFLELN